MLDQAQEARRLLQVGRRGTAMVMSIRDTGTLVGENPETELELCIALDGQNPYKVTHRQVISKLAIGSLCAGAKVPIRVDPHDPRRVLVG